MSNNNPLQQYFRRPAIYIKLPSGGQCYDDTVIENTKTGELPVYPMTAIDEITSKTPDALFNGQAVVDIIQSCVPNIKNAWQINSIDLESILIAIRVASTGEKMEFSSVCPNCSEDSSYDLDLIDVLRTQQNIDFSQPLRVRELEIKFKPLTYSEMNQNNMAQYELQKFIYDLQNVEDTEQKQAALNENIKSLTLKTAEIVASTIEYVKTPETTVFEQPYIVEFLTQCDKKTNELIRDTSVELKNKNQLRPLDITCQHCSHKYKQQLTLNITDFFA
jgi:hypothetical protein